MVGRTVSNAVCHKEQVGILLPIVASQGGSITPSTCGSLGGHWTKGIYGEKHPIGSNPAIAGEVRVTGSTFYRFNGECGSSFVMMTTMQGGMDSAEANAAWLSEAASGSLLALMSAAADPPPPTPSAL